jgi:hypothetical protein
VLLIVLRPILCPGSLTHLIGRYQLVSSKRALSKRFHYRLFIVTSFLTALPLNFFFSLSTNYHIYIFKACIRRSSGYYLYSLTVFSFDGGSCMEKQLSQSNLSNLPFSIRKRLLLYSWLLLQKYSMNSYTGSVASVHGFPRHGQNMKRSTLS